MKKPVIEAIFLDFGNVCARFEFTRFSAQFSAHTGTPVTRIESLLFGDVGHGYSPLFAQFECGKISSREFFDEFTRALGCVGGIDFETFAQLWVDVFVGENAALDLLLARLPHAKFLLSNTNTIIHERYIMECAIVRNHFPFQAQHILSCRVGSMKPDPLIYQHALKRAGVRAEHALFIDDLPGNIAAWEQIGGHGLLYHAGKDPMLLLKFKMLQMGLTS